MSSRLAFGAPANDSATAPGTITTIAGGGPADGDEASSSGIPRPHFVTRDTAGNLYFSSADVGRVYKVDPAGRLHLVAGGNRNPYYGVGGLAIDATLRGPRGLATDANGNLFIAEDTGRILRVDVATGILTVVAGNLDHFFGQAGPFGGDGGPATSASLNHPTGIAVDTAGNLYIADSANQRVRRVNLASGIITTIAGTGAAGYNGDAIAATNAQLNYPLGVAVDGAGHVFIADRANRRVRRIDAGTGLITSIIGPSVLTGQVTGVAVDDEGNAYATVEAPSNAVYRIDASSGASLVVAGNGLRGFSGDGGPSTSASLSLDWDSGLAVDALGRLYVADANNYRVREVSTPGPDSTRTITTFSGNGSPGDGGPAANGSLNAPWGISVDPAGNLFIADSAQGPGGGTGRVRRVDALTRVITTVAGERRRAKRRRRSSDWRGLGKHRWRRRRQLREAVHRPLRTRTSDRRRDRHDFEGCRIPRYGLLGRG